MPDWLPDDFWECPTDQDRGKFLLNRFWLHSHPHGPGLLEKPSPTDQGLIPAKLLWNGTVFDVEIDPKTYAQIKAQSPEGKRTTPEG
jgi:hypothetical protein